MKSHLFISYAHEDKPLMIELQKHLSLLKRQGLIETWTDQEIALGDEWRPNILDELKSANIIILLISSDFLASDFCWGIELKHAMGRHREGSALVLPIILRPCDWNSAPFGKLQALPNSSRPVSSHSDKDIAWNQVTQGIRKLVENLPKTQLINDTPLTLESEDSIREIWELTLSASIEEINPEVMSQITELLKKISGDTKLSLERVRIGSVIIEFLISSEAARLLAIKINNRLLEKIHGYKILEFKKNHSEVDKETPNMLTLGKYVISPGERRTIELPVTDLYTNTSLKMPVQIVRGKKSGPILFLSAAIHGDEINGVEIVRRVLDYKGLDNIRGTLIAVPIVNVQGFLAQSRYTPDRRDLNRCFPGNSHGSVASRLAHLFVQEIVLKSDCGIDLHTAAIHRDNLPQVRAQLHNPETARLAKAFDAPVMLNTNLRDGSLRHYADEQGIPILLYEAGEALRFDESSIRIGARGVLNVMRELGMLRLSRKKTLSESVTANSSHWIRAQCSGILRAKVGLGSSISQGQMLGTISNPFGTHEQTITAEHAGILIGRTNLPLANEGDAIFHIACFGDNDQPSENIEAANIESNEWGLPVTDHQIPTQ